MCLLVDYDLQEQYSKKWKKLKKIRVWKVLSNDNAALYSPYMHTHYKSGYNYAYGDCVVNTYNEVESGIHVLLTREEARIECGYGDVIVSVYANLKDLIGVGYYGESKSAAFKKVFLPKSERDRALKRKSKSCL